MGAGRGWLSVGFFSCEEEWDFPKGGILSEKSKAQGSAQGDTGRRKVFQRDAGIQLRGTQGNRDSLQAGKCSTCKKEAKKTQG